MKIIHAHDYNDMSRKAANIISAHIILKPDCTLGLATGSTPIGTYSQLAEWYDKGDLHFRNVHSINLDEYCGIAPSHPQSYHSFMNQNLFSKVNINPVNTHLPNGAAADLDAECAAYDNLISTLGIDIQLLGIGHNGHIGFNEPGHAFEKTTHIVNLSQRTIDANSRLFGSVDDVPKTAVTMGIKAIMSAKSILLIANGEGKADILYQAFFGPITPQIPASVLQLHPSVTVVADDAALSTILKEKGNQLWI